jgi:hypothetical protein
MLYPEEMRSLPALPLSATSEEGKATATRLGVNVPLTTYGILISCVILWLWFSQGLFPIVSFQSSSWLSRALKGGYFGLSWAGIWLWLWLVLSNPERLRREVPGYGARFAKQITVCVVGAFSEELWRVLCITALLARGYSAGFSVTAVALPFALAFLGNGPEGSILAALEGINLRNALCLAAILLCPVCSSLSGPSRVLVGRGTVFPRRQRKSWIRGILCPICKAELSRFQVKIRDPFDCPSCHKQISVSDSYRGTMHWVGLSAYLIFAAATMVLLENQVSDTLFVLLVWPVVFGVGTSGLMLYQRLFPPQLQYGSPTFITLNLEQHRSEADDFKNKRD